MTEQVADATSVSYSYRPSVFGAFREFSLTERGIEWATGPRSGSIPFDRVRRLRVSYRPHSMQSHRFVTELWADGSPKLLISSSSWKSMMEHERLDGAYSSFVRELHRRISRANGATQGTRRVSMALQTPGRCAFAFTQTRTAGGISAPSST